LCYNLKFFSWFESAGEAGADPVSEGGRGNGAVTQGPFIAQMDFRTSYFVVRFSILIYVYSFLTVTYFEYPYLLGVL